MQAPAGFRGRFAADLQTRALYAEGAGIFRILPAAVAAPADTADLQALVRWAAATGTGLVPRGAGSGMPGHNVGPGVVVDLRRGFREPVRVDRDARIARAGAALTWRDVNGAATAFGLRLPPDPSSGAFCTVGGMVATNAAGARSRRHGAMRRWVRALEFVTADGETGRTGGPDGGTRTAAEQRFHSDVAPAIEAARADLLGHAPRTRKNSSGYDLLPPPRGDWIQNLLVGSEGTLAIVTAVDVALAPLPAAVSTLLVTLRSLEDLMPAIAALERFDPESIELLDRTWLDFVRAAAHAPLPPGTQAVLLVDLEGDGRDAEAALRPIASSVVRADDAGTAAKLWETRHLASPLLAGLPDHLRSLQLVEDGCVPREHLGAYIARLRERVTAHGFDVVIFGHAGDGHVHANVLADVTEADVAVRLLACLEDVSALQIELGGTLSGEHGDGRLRAPFLPRLLGAQHATLSRGVKRAFDPAGILNPGVKIAAAPAFTAAQLKVGPAAPALPDDVATLLRRIEREALWGEDRLGEG